MPNPRYISKDGLPQVELLRKLSKAKATFYNNLMEFCEHEKMQWNYNEMKNVDRIYLIGSHAEEEEWSNETSDIDFKIVNSKGLPANLWAYKQKVLDPNLCPQGTEKKYWIDIFFARRDDEVREPRFDLTKYWNKNI